MPSGEGRKHLDKSCACSLQNSQEGREKRRKKKEKRVQAHVVHATPLEKCTARSQGFYPLHMFVQKERKQINLLNARITCLVARTIASVPTPWETTRLRRLGRGGPKNTWEMLSEAREEGV